MTSVYWADISAPQLNAWAKEDAVVLVPLGATEQHGPHLPTGVDAFTATAVSASAAEIATERGHRVVVAPPLTLGLSTHHVPLGGTISIRLRTLYHLLRDVCRSIQAAGFNRIVIVNGHGGNITALDAITNELAAEISPGITCAAYVSGAVEKISETLESQRMLIHACEGETSLMLSINPDLVNMSVAENSLAPPPDIDLSVGAPIHVWRTFDEIDPNGVAGYPLHASAEKGHTILQACAEALADQLISDRPWRHRNTTAPTGTGTRNEL